MFLMKWLKFFNTLATLKQPLNIAIYHYAKCHNVTPFKLDVRKIQTLTKIYNNVIKQW